MQETSGRPKWKRFEEFVAGIQKQLAPDAVVEINVRLPGAAGVLRQIDVCIRKQVGQFRLLIVMDCKDWKDPVDVKGVEEFAGLVEDVGANKGAMVCNSGFTPAAKAKARLKGIDLFAAIDAESVDWPVYASLPALCDFRKLRRYNLRFQHNSPGPFKVPNMDPRYIEVFSSTEERIGNIINLVRQGWNDGRLSNDPGHHEGIPIHTEPMFFKIDDVLYGPVEITVSFDVEGQLFFGQLPLVKTSGLRDEHTGAYTTMSFETADLNAQEVERNWTRVDDEHSLSVKPVLTIEAIDHYPNIESGKE